MSEGLLFFCPLRPDNSHVPATYRNMSQGLRLHNVVGFQSSDLERYVCNWRCVNFEDVAGEGQTLGKLGVNEKFVRSTLQLLDEGGATMIIELPAGDHEEVEGFFEYWREEDFDETVIVMTGENVAGWYLRDSKDRLYCMNDYEAPYGSMFMIDCSDSKSAVITSGDVFQDDAHIPLERYACNWTGNCSPVDIMLGDLMVNEKFVRSTLQFLDEGGATKVFELPAGENEEVEGFFEYWRVEDFDDSVIVMTGDKVAGWYLRDSDDRLYCMNDEVEILAGDGFMIDCSDSSSEVIIPNPIPEAE